VTAEQSADELCFTPAHELAGLIAAKKLSPVELIDAVIARAERAHQATNCFAFKLYDEAREAARGAEAAVMRGDALGPLHGVPITIKDNLATVGQLMTNGSHAMMEYRPTADALVWQRARAAGAILLAKTTTPEFAHKVLTDSLPFGVTTSPWSKAHTPGGSSGGAAAAVAAGAGPLAIGTDGGGSIRCPASCAGLFGIKATLGRIPFEIIPDTFANYAFTGPITRDAHDLGLFLAVMSGPADVDAHTIGIPALRPEDLKPKQSVRGLKVGWIGRFGGVAVDGEVAALTARAVKQFEDAGAIVEALDVPAFADVFDYYVVIATTAHAARLGPVAEKHRSRMTDSMLGCIRQGGTFSAAQWQMASDRRTALFRTVQRLFDKVDVIATPTLNAPPKPVDEGGAINTPMYAEWAKSLYPFNLTGHPAASAPCGFTAGGLPVGLQIIAPWYEEARLIDIAAFLQAANPESKRRPVL
jgi:aspartyl-tRNA(Asn)/glutamyl-tRNA(Gln) amidotransferase subunit A